MEPIYTKRIGNAEIKVYEDLTNVSDSLLLDSDTLIATYEDKAEELYVSYVVRGEVNLIYKGENYRHPVDFPDELVKIIRNGTVYENQDIVYVDLGNWFNGEQWSDDFQTIRDLIFDDVVDIENMSPEQIAEDIEKWAKEIGKGE